MQLLLSPRSSSLNLNPADWPRFCFRTISAARHPRAARPLWFESGRRGGVSDLGGDGQPTAEGSAASASRSPSARTRNVAIPIARSAESRAWKRSSAEARCPRQAGPLPPPPRLTSRPVVFAAVFQRVVGVDDVARGPVHLSPGGVEPPDFERQERAIAQRATRHSHHPVAERRVVPHRGLGSRELEPSSTRLATGARLITQPRQLRPASAARAVEGGAIAQRQLGAAACFARPPEPPALPNGLVDDVWSSVGSSDLERRSRAGGNFPATQPC